MPPRRGISRWTRRITGLLATMAFLGVGVASYEMIAPAHDSTAGAALAPAPTVAPAHHHRKAKHRAHRPKRLTKAQKAARTAAVAEVRRQGYIAAKPSDYDPRATFRVLIGRPVGDAGGAAYAFFFSGGSYLGRDAASPSADLKVVSHGKRNLTLSYGTCCPTGHVHVHFRLEDGRVHALQAVPPSYLRAVRR